MADSVPETIGRGFGELLLDALSFIGLGLGGGQAAAAGLLQRLQQSSMQEHGDTPLSPAGLAEAVVKHAVGQEWAAAEARKAGMTGNVFDVAVKTTGNPPGPGELLDLWRRGIINEGQVVHGLQQGYLKDEWTGPITALKEVLLPVGELVAAAVQNHLPRDVVRALLSQHGVSAENFRVLFDNAGNPPGPQQMLNLWVRGYATEADVDQALRESRLKDKWIPVLKRLAVRKLPQRTITMLVSHSAMDDGTAIRHLRELGFEQADAEALVKSAHFTRAAPQRELSVTAIKELYAERAITRDQAVTDLVGLHYAADVAGQLLDLADGEVTARLRRATIGRVRAAYTAHRVTRAQASTDLDVLGVPAGQRDEMLDLWTTELELNPRELTAAQLVAAGKRGIIPRDEMLARLEADGYSPRDALILAMLGGAEPIPGAPTGGT